MVVDSSRKRWLWFLVALLGCRLLFHAVYWPAFEGPDEPFHLARTRAVLEGPPALAPSGSEVDAKVVAAVRSLPCGEDLSRAFSCVSFRDGDNSAEFNVLRALPQVEAAETYPNYESHQPPLFYLLGAGVIKSLDGVLDGDPVRQLLTLRFLSVGLVVGALLLLLATSGQRFGPDWSLGVVVVLLIPGGAESLARCANDALVFAWAALVVWDLEFERRAWVQPLLSALGPLIKLTAIPIVALAVFSAAFQRRWLRAGLTALTGLLFIPVQWLRGWAWGGTVEFNASSAQNGALDESAIEILMGVGHSLVTFIKSSIWLGGWSFFRAPFWVWVVCGVSVLLLARTARVRWDWGTQGPHLLGLAIAALATFVFFLSHRLYFDQWGGVGGWYLWGWLPWLAVFVAKSGNFSGNGRRSAEWSVLIALAVLNLAWMVGAHKLYS